MALDVLTTATATQIFRNGNTIVNDGRFGIVAKLTSIIPTKTSGEITLLASGLNTRFDDPTYYTA